MSSFESHTDGSIPAAILGGICFGITGWYYFFQPHHFHRVMEETARHSPSFVECIRFLAKPIGIVSFLIAAVCFGAAIKGLLT